MTFDPQLQQIAQQIDRLWKAFRAQRPPEVPVHVGAVYTTDAGQTINPNVQIIVNFEDLVYDTHNAVTIGANWRFTCPVAGRYLVCAITHTANVSWTAGQEINLRVVRNNDFTAPLMIGAQHLHVTTTTFGVVYGTTVVRCVRGDFLDVRLFHTRTAALTLLASGLWNRVEITRIP